MHRKTSLEDLSNSHSSPTSTKKVLFTILELSARSVSTRTHTLSDKFKPLVHQLDQGAQRTLLAERSSTSEQAMSHSHSWALILVKEDSCCPPVTRWETGTCRPMSCWIGNLKAPMTKSTGLYLIEDFIFQAMQPKMRPSRMKSSYFARKELLRLGV